MNIRKDFSVTNLVQKFFLVHNNSKKTFCNELRKGFIFVTKKSLAMERSFSFKTSTSYHVTKTTPFRNMLHTMFYQ